MLTESVKELHTAPLKVSTSSLLRRLLFQRFFGLFKMGFLFWDYVTAMTPQRERREGDATFAAGIPGRSVKRKAKGS